MSREIKFRAWFSVGKKMVYNLGFDQDSFKTIEDCEDMPSVCDLDCLSEEGYEATFNYELMEYTGLKDKNGKEIYEGDVVKFADWKPKVIEFGTCGFIGFGLKNTEKFLMNYDSENLEVIGNIYENPDLLK